MKFLKAEYEEKLFPPGIFSLHIKGNSRIMMRKKQGIIYRLLWIARGDWANLMFDVLQAPEDLILPQHTEATVTKCMAEDTRSPQSHAG